MCKDEGGHVAEKPGKVLIIDDDADFVECVRLALEHEGHTVLAATSGEAGVATARRERPEVIIVDLLMVPLDGFATCSALRSQAETERSAILVVSAIGRKLHKTPSSLDVGTRLDADGFLDKPVKTTLFVSTVREMLGLARSRASEAKGER